MARFFRNVRMIGRPWHTDVMWKLLHPPKIKRITCCHFLQTLQASQRHKLIDNFNKIIVCCSVISYFCLVFKNWQHWYSTGRNETIVHSDDSFLSVIYLKIQINSLWEWLINTPPSSWSVVVWWTDHQTGNQFQTPAAATQQTRTATVTVFTARWVQDRLWKCQLDISWNIKPADVQYDYE